MRSSPGGQDDPAGPSPSSWMQACTGAFMPGPAGRTPRAPALAGGGWVRQGERIVPSALRWEINRRRAGSPRTERCDPGTLERHVDEPRRIAAVAMAATTDLGSLG